MGSLHAVDARMALEHARDVYTRRLEGVSIWVVRSSDIAASDPLDADAFFEPARDKVYRYPTFYTIPDRGRRTCERSARRGGAADNDAHYRPTCTAPRRHQRLILSASALSAELDRACAGAGGVIWRLANICARSDRPGAAPAHLRGRSSRGAWRDRRTRWRFCAMRPSSRNVALGRTARMATSATTIVRQLSCCRCRNARAVRGACPSSSDVRLRRRLPPKPSRRRAITCGSAPAGWCGSATVPRRVMLGSRRRSMRSGASPMSCSRPMRSMRKLGGCAPGIAPLIGRCKVRGLRVRIAVGAVLRRSDADSGRAGFSAYLWHGKRGVHTEHLGHMLAEMQHLPRTYPGVTVVSCAMSLTAPDPASAAPGWQQDVWRLLATSAPTRTGSRC